MSYLSDRDFSRLRQNKSGEVWFSNLRDFDVKLYPPNARISENHILAHKGCCDTKFLHALENDHVLLAYPSQETGALFQLFLKGVKNRPKLQ